MVVSFTGNPVALWGTNAHTHMVVSFTRNPVALGYKWFSHMVVSFKLLGKEIFQIDHIHNDILCIMQVLQTFSV